MSKLPHEEFLKHILSQPTAPFRERHPVNAFIQRFEQEDVPFFRDPTGNIVVGVSSKAEYQKLLREKSAEPVRLFIAHLDHPGFLGTSWKSPDELLVKWHGGSPFEHLDGASVWLADEHGWAGDGRLAQVKLASHGRAIDTASVRLSKRLDPSVDALKLFGGFRFRAPQWQEGELIYTKAADDLVGSFAIAALAIDLLGKSTRGKRKRTSKRLPFIGLLSRAEEVGFIGTIGHLEEGWWKVAKRPLLVVSLETSRQLPGAEIGKGPVLRLGDKSGVFDSDSLRAFQLMATRDFAGRFQRRIMDGGTCEATAAIAYGLPAVGISVPLGNYHNQSIEGGPDSAGANGPAPEFVHLGDVAGLLELCSGLLQPKLAWADPWKEKLQEFRKDLRGYKALLKDI